MSHDLTTNTDANGVEQVEFAYAGEPPWHRLGTELPLGSSVIDGAKEAGVLWTVNREPIFTEQNEEIPGVKAIVRQDNREVLGTLSKAYTVIQNEEMVNIADMVEADFSSIGSLRGGRQLFTTLKIPQIEKVALSDGDELKNYVLLTWGHDGGVPIRFGLVPIRVVCQNTLTAALGSFSGFSIRHLPNAEDKVKLVKEVLNMAIKWNGNFVKAANMMKAVEMNSDEATSYFKNVLSIKDQPKAVEKPEALMALPAKTKSSRNLTKLQELFHTQPGAEKTLWGAFNAVTHFTDHNQQTRVNRQYSILFGNGGSMKTKAFREAGDILVKVNR